MVHYHLSCRQVNEWFRADALSCIGALCYFSCKPLQAKMSNQFCKLAQTDKTHSCCRKLHSERDQWTLCSTKPWRFRESNSSWYTWFESRKACQETTCSLLGCFTWHRKCRVDLWLRRLISLSDIQSLKSCQCLFGQVKQIVAFSLHQWSS